MATNPLKGPGRVGAVKKREQNYNPKIKRWTEINTETHKFVKQMNKKQAL